MFESHLKHSHHTPTHRDCSAMSAGHWTHNSKGPMAECVETQ